jgi:hypothetical protein
LLEPQAPFKQISISGSPIIVGTEEDPLSITQRSAAFHRKELVVFPSGAFESDMGWIVSIGVNDCSNVLIKVTPEDLRL